MARTTIRTNDIKDLNVTSGKIETNLAVSGNLVVAGNLTVNGTTTTISTDQLSIEDNLITLNSNYTGDPNGVTPPPDSGIEIERGTGTNASIMWDETNDRWNISHPLYYASTANAIALNIKQSNNNDTDIWNIDDGTGGYGFFLRYKGTGNGDDNALELWADNQTATAQRAYRVQQSGAILFDQTATFNGNIVLAASKTVDGVDISAHDANTITDHKHVTDAILAALAGTSGTAPSSTNKLVDNADSRLTNARTPVTHGDAQHSALAYFDIVSDGTTTKTATTANQSMKFVASGAASVTVGNATGYDATITIGATNNYVNATSFDKSTEVITYTRSGLSNITTDVSGTWLKLTSGTQQVVTGDVKITGNLIISGTTTTVDTVNLTVSDNLITLNSDVTGTPSEDSGVEIERGTSPNVAILWSEATDRWTLTEDGTNYYRILTQTFTGDITVSGNITATSFIGNASTATKLQTARTISLTGDVTGSGTFDGGGNLAITATVADDSHSHSNYLTVDKYLSGVSGTVGGTITFTVSNGTNITWDSSHTHNGYLSLTSAGTIDVNSTTLPTNLYLGSSTSWTNKATAGNDATGFFNMNTYPGAYYSQLWFDTSGDSFYHRTINNGTLRTWRKVWTDGNLTFGTGSTNMAAGNHTHANLSAGNGITGTTYTGGTAQDWSIVSAAGTAGSVGTIVVTADTVGVSLGTTSTTAAAGNHTHTINSVTWPGGQNLICNATANGQEWSVDMSPGTYTGTYWHVWSTIKSGSCIKADCDTGNVSTGYNLSVGGTLTVTGASATVNGQAVVLTNDSRLTDARTPSTHGDDKHNHQAFARISFAAGQSQAVWTHNKNWSDYIVQITPDSPETHFYYSNRTANSITICLDDEAYEALNVDVMLTKATTITTTGFTMS